MFKYMKRKIRISTGHLCTLIERRSLFPKAQHSVYQALGILISEHPTLQLPSITFELFRDEDDWVPQINKVYWHCCSEHLEKFGIPPQFKNQPFSQAGFVEALEPWSDHDDQNEYRRLVDDLRSGGLRASS